MNGEQIPNELMIEHQLKDLQRLKGIAQKVDSSFLVDQILNYVYQSLRTTIPCDRLGFAMLVNEGSDLRACWVRAEHTPRLKLGYQASLARSSLSTVIQSQQPRILNDLEDYLVQYPNSQSTRLMVEEGILSSLTCPLQVDGTSIGVLFFSSRQKHSYQSDHVLYFQQIASELAEILQHGVRYEVEFQERRQSYDDIQNVLPHHMREAYNLGQRDSVDEFGSTLLELAQKYDESIEDIQFVTKLTQRLNAGLTLEEILDYIFEEFQGVVPYERIGMAFLEEKTLRLEWVRSNLSEVHLTTGFECTLSDINLRRSEDIICSHIFHDLEEYVLRHPHVELVHLLLQEGMRANMICPLRVMNKTIGFLFFSSTTPCAYRKRHADFFDSISEPMAAILEKARLYQMVKQEQEKAERLLQHLLPPSVVQQLKERSGAVAQQYEQVTVLFAELVDIRQWIPSPTKLVAFLNELFSSFDDLCARHGVTKLRSYGDRYIVVSGAPLPEEDHALRAAAFALDMMAIAQRFKTPLEAPVQLRVGLHSGPVVGGVVGKQILQYDLWGEAVNIASRMESHGIPGMIQISAETFSLLDERFACRKRGRVAMKGGSFYETYLLVGLHKSG